MEIKKGYKQTEVGIIPEEWEIKKLGDICRFSKGKGISKNDITDNGIECIRYGELYTTYNENIIRIFSKTNLSKENLVLSEKNDIIIPSSGETAIDIAKASCVSKDNVALGGDLNILKSNQNGVFLSYFLNHVAKRQISNFAQGVSIVHLYGEQLKQVKVAIPALKEQEKIAEILLYYDKVIEQQELLIEKEKEFKKGMMQKIFSQEIRFKGDDGKDYSEWEKKRLGDIVELIDGDRGKNYPNENDIQKKGILFLSTANFYNNKLTFTSSDKFITIEKFNQLKKGKVTHNDLIITLRGSIGNIVLFENKYYSTAFINAQMMIIKPLKINKYYLYFSLQDMIIKKTLDKISSGSAQPQLTKKDLVDLLIRIPSLKEQEKIATFLSNVDKKIELLENKLQLLKNEKKGIMQKLLTGEIRV